MGSADWIVLAVAVLVGWAGCVAVAWEILHHGDRLPDLERDPEVVAWRELSR